MTRYQHRKARLQNFIRALATGRDLALVLEECRLTPGRASQILRSTACRRELERFHNLRDTQCNIMLRNASPRAVSAVTNILDAEKPDARIKSALNLLKLNADNPFPDEYNP